MRLILIGIAALLVACDPQTETLTRAIDLSRQQKYTEAKEAYEVLLKMDSGNPLYHNNYGWVLIKLGEYEQAKEHLMFAQKHESYFGLQGAPDKNLKSIATVKKNSGESSTL